MDRKDFSCYFGNRFGFLTVVEINGKDKHNNKLFKCNVTVEILPFVH